MFQRDSVNSLHPFPDSQFFDFFKFQLFQFFVRKKAQWHFICSLYKARTFISRLSISKQHKTLLIRAFSNLSCVEGVT